MKKLSPALTVLTSLVLLTIVGMLLESILPVEMFGSQGGAMVQLATSHVPTEEDVALLRDYPNRVKKDLIDMTGYW